MFTRNKSQDLPDPFDLGIESEDKQKKKRKSTFGQSQSPVFATPPVTTEPMSVPPEKRMPSTEKRTSKTPQRNRARESSSKPNVSVGTTPLTAAATDSVRRKKDGFSHSDKEKTPIKEAKEKKPKSPPKVDFPVGASGISMSPEPFASSTTDHVKRKKGRSKTPTPTPIPKQKKSKQTLTSSSSVPAEVSFAHPVLVWKAFDFSDSPSARAHTSSVVVGSKIILFGGKGSKVFRDLWVFDMLLKSWEKTNILGDLPTSRYRCCLSNVEEGSISLIIFGGQKSSAKVYSDAYTILVEDGSFHSRRFTGSSSSPFPLFQGHVSTYMNGKIYFFGGVLNGKKTNQLSAFCPRTFSWTYYPCLGKWPSPRDGHCCVSHSKYLYIFGGHDGQTFLNDLWRLDVQLFVWTQIKMNGNGPSPRGSAAATILQDRFIVLSHGRDDNSLLSDFFIFDMQLEQWDRLAMKEPTLPPRYGHSMWSYGSNLFLFGGFGHDEIFGQMYLMNIKEDVSESVAAAAVVETCQECIVLREKLQVEEGLRRDAEKAHVSKEAKMKSELRELRKELEKQKNVEISLREEMKKFSAASSSSSSSLAVIDADSAYLLPLEDIDRMLAICNENLKNLVESRKKAKIRINREKIEKLSQIEYEKKRVQQEMDEETVRLMQERVTERPPEVSSFLSSLHALFVFRRQFFLIPSIKRPDDYSCRTESTVLSGDDIFTTEEWLLSRPTDWSTNPNWSKVETLSAVSSTKSESGSLRIDPDDFDSSFLSIAQAIRRMNCDISTLWRRGLIGAQKSSGVKFFMELHPQNQRVEIVYAYRTLQTAFTLMMHVDEMLDHWSERFKGYEWLKYAVVQEEGDSQEDLIPIQNIHLAMAEWEAEVKSVTMNKSYKIESLAPDLLLPPNLLLTFEKDLQIGRQIGKGGFANIFEGKFQKQTVAVKMCNVKAPIISQFDSDEEKKKKEAARYRASVRAWRKFWHEIMMLYEAKGHPNTLQLLGYCRAPFCIVTAYLPHGDLYHLLANEYQYRTIPYTASLRFALSAAECLQNLHRKNPPILHNDFKSPNIFLDVKNQKTFDIDCYLGDFGCARRCFAPVLSKRRLVANPGWLAPEQISGDYFTEKVDVYSFGVYLHELLSRQHPFSEYRIKNKQLFEEQIVGGLRPTIPEKWPLDYRMLIMDCWQTKAELRPSFDEIVERLKMALALAEEGEQ